MNRLKNFIKKMFYKYDFVIKKLMMKVVYDVNKNILDISQKKVLISYLSEQFLFGLDQKSTHTNFLENSLLIQYYINKNYSIDIVDCTDKNFFPKSDYYDVIIGFGEPYRKAINVNEKAIKIIYLTESSPKFSFLAESNRVEYYKKRNKTNKKINLFRTGTHYKDQDLELSNYLILIGSEITLNTYLDNYNINKNKFQIINPTGLFNNKFNIENKKLSKNNNFLWFGSRGVIHKGLDILCDVFSQNSNMNLYAYGVNNNEYKYLTKSKNIYINSKINVLSDEFLSLIDNINYIILPSCSEGLSTAVITCMMHGIIPIVTRETGLILPENTGFYIDDLSITAVNVLINNISMINIDKIQIRRRNCYDFAHNNFNLTNYHNNITRILENIL
jgi:glycosyltransferase involved in cell wall biosynthesis